MRPLTIVANWKMHTNLAEGQQLAKAIAQELKSQQLSSLQVVMAPPFVHLTTLQPILVSIDNVYLGAQNCHAETSGAYTGEVSVHMLQDAGVQFVIIGHSERCQQWGEASPMLAKKATNVLKHGLRPIFCCGESLQQRADGNSQSVVIHQIQQGLGHLTALEVSQVIIAYEPVWAIGTGNTPELAQIQAMHHAIRTHLAAQYSHDIAQAIPLLYGGSCQASNVAAICQQKDVDGVLVGGASLSASSFLSIINALRQVSGRHDLV